MNNSSNDGGVDGDDYDMIVMMMMKGKANKVSEVRKREGEDTWRIRKYNIRNKREKTNMAEVKFLNAT